MESSSEPIQIPLTGGAEQLIRGLSGQVAQILELTPEAAHPAGGAGRTLQFRWRLSTATSQPTVDPPAGE